MPKKEQESTVIDDNQESLEEQRFQEQCFLMDFSDEFMSRNQNFNYTNFAQINTKDSVAIILNKILGKGVERLMEVKPFELSFLQPHFRLYKVHYVGQEEKEVELRFDNSNKEGRFDDIKRVDDLSKNRLQLGGGAGLKSFEWEDLGTNPGDSGKAFKAVIEMHFQNAADFFYNRARAGELHTSFADLVRVPPKRFTSSGHQDEKHFRIKVQVGWSAPPPNIIIDDALCKALKNSVVTMFLSLTTHRLQYFQNGTLNVTAEYIGAIESKLLSPETDVFYTNADIERQIQNSVANQKAEEKQLEDFRRRGIQAPSTFKKITDAIGSTIVSSLTKDDAAALSTISNDELVVDRLQENIELREINRETLVKENRAKAYKRLLTALEETDRLFYIDIPKEEIELLGQSRSDGKQFTREVAANRRAARLKKSKETTLVKKGIEPSSWSDVNDYNKDIEQIVNASTEEIRNRLADNVSRNNTKTNNAKPGGDKRINFFYLGDLVEAALDVVYGLERGKKIVDRPENADMRFLLGPIEIVDAQGNKRIRSLADVPISLNLFQAWFLKNVVRPARDKYLLRDFLRDLCSELVLKALQPDCFGPNAKGVRNRISFSIFSIPAKDNQEPIPRQGRHNIEDILNNIVEKRGGSSKNMKHYLMLYVSGHKPDKLRGNFGDDTDNGVYHFNIGANRGLLKNIDFNKADIQYLPESRISDSEDVQKGDAFLSEPYNAVMSMWGNSIFKPGMMLYINPSSLGMGPSVPKKERLPIGGYYTCVKVLNKIAPGLFSTELTLNWESSGDENKNPAVSEGKTEDPTPSIDAISGGKI